MVSGAGGGEGGGATDALLGDYSDRPLPTPMRTPAASALAAASFAASAASYGEPLPAGVAPVAINVALASPDAHDDAPGVFSGRIEKLLDPTTDPKAVCDQCTDDRKDKPVLGMEILRGLKASGSDAAVFEGGTIVDPNNGKVYRTRLKPVEDGKKLEMRGYIGPFYRTQVWQRVE